MNTSLKISAVFCIMVILGSCTAGKRISSARTGDYRIAFYNVENLYNAVDDPAPNDEEFTPGSKKVWTQERYQTKLEHLAKVVEGMSYPALLGLAEVENAAVLKDFCEKTSLSTKDYSICHFESPDFRGIDVALLYRKPVFRVLESSFIRIDFPAELKGDIPTYTTRDLLVVKGIFNKRDTLHVFVAHLPSRSGGQAESEPKRLFVARQIRQKADEIFAKNPASNIVIMGDMNDETTDPSIAQILKAQGLESPWSATSLYNCFAKLDAEGKGSYNYRGDWNMLDQVILSSNLLNKKSNLRFHNAFIFQQDWMMYTDPKYGKSPSRTYGGDHYFGGYSDHLPVVVELR
jgi:endonuclease/exonuclease/phosphatase family metal-dependent hydrolase